MQLSKSLLLISVGAVMATELESHMRAVLPEIAERDLPTINKVVTDTDNAIKDLTKAINSFNGDPQQLINASNAMLGVLSKGVTDITGTSPISLNDAVTLQGTVSGLQNDANDLITALSNKKGTFEQAGLCDVVFKQSDDMGKVAKQLIDAVVQKVPSDVQQIATQVSAGFTQTLQQSQQAYAPGNCTNKGTASPGTGGAAGSGSGSGTGTGTGNASSGNTPVAAGAGAFAAPITLVCVAVAAGLML